MKSKQKYYDSIAQAASALGLDKEKLRQAKSLGCPAFKASRVYEVELLTWLNLNQAKMQTPGQSGSLEDMRLFEQVRKLRIKNDKDDGKLIPVASISEKLSAIAAWQLGVLRQRLENELPSQVAGLDPASARVVFKRVVDEICDKMQGLLRENQQ